MLCVERTRAGEEELGFRLHKKRRKRHISVTVTDLDFADDLALLIEEIEQVQEVLRKLEKEAEQVELYCNSKKTEIKYSTMKALVSVKAIYGQSLNIIENFKYLDAWSTEK